MDMKRERLMATNDGRIGRLGNAKTSKATGRKADCVTCVLELCEGRMMMNKLIAWLIAKGIIRQYAHCIGIYLPPVQVINSNSSMSIWLWKVHIFLDWWKYRPEGAKLISVSWKNPR